MKSPGMGDLPNGGGSYGDTTAAFIGSGGASVGSGVGGDLNTSIASAGTEQATTLEYDFKWMCRLSFNPLATAADASGPFRGAASAAATQPPPMLKLHNNVAVAAPPVPAPPAGDALADAPIADGRPPLLEMTVVRVDNASVCVTGLVPAVVSRAESVSYFPLEIESDPFVQDWKDVQNQRVWWGYNSRGRFGLVVPIKPLHSHLVTEACGAGTAGRVLLPRCVTLDPPFSNHRDFHDNRSNDRSTSRTPHNASALHNMSLRGSPQQHGLLSQSFIENGSFVRAMHLGDHDGSASAALLGRMDLGTTLPRNAVVLPPVEGVDGGHEEPRHLDDATAKVIQPLAETIESVFGEGLQTAAGADNNGGGLLNTDWALSLFPPKPTTSTKSGGAKADEALSSLPWRDAGEMLPHYFQMHASVTAAGYAAAMCRHAARMSFDQSQFVAVIGDSRGLFVVAPGRDAAEHCHGVQPLYIDGGSSIAALGRGAYDVSLSGHVYPSTGDNVAGFEASLPQRLQLPTPLHRIRSITTVTVPAPHDAQPADTTTIMEKLFTTDDVVPLTLAHPAAVWESTIEVVRRIPTHPAWREPVNLLASAPSSSNAGKRGGRSKSVTKLSAKR